jgi:hypothetical protein
MHRTHLRAGDEVAILPYENASSELVCEIAKIERIIGTTIHLESHRMYSRATGRGLTRGSTGVIVPATANHWESLRARYGLQYKSPIRDDL